ncbi:MAG: phosphotransferase [Pseudonocardiaceae bacterium]|nr:phosphotransferase [Pseudonocardiaceae bacterium]
MSVETTAEKLALDQAGADSIVEAISAAIAAGEAVLTSRFGATITLDNPEDLAGSGPATVVRARVASTPFSLPRTLVIKHYPEVSGGWDPFAHEAVSYQLFTALAEDERRCPELIAQDATGRVIVLEDLGRAATVEDKLLGADARAAEGALLSWARSLGQLHASTAGREADFDALMRRFGGGDVVSGLASAVELACTELPSVLEEVLGVGTPRSVRELLDRAGVRAEAAPYRAFSPVDLAPDNNLVTNAGVRFLDFERGCVRNALLDAAYLRMPFASSAGALALPAGMTDAMLASWRAEVCDVWPELSDDAVLDSGLLDAQLVWLALSTWQLLPELVALHGGGAAGPPRTELLPFSSSDAEALSARWAQLADDAEGAGVRELADYARTLGKQLATRFQQSTELEPYLAFR